MNHQNHLENVTSKMAQQIDSGLPWSDGGGGCRNQRAPRIGDIQRHRAIEMDSTTSGSYESENSDCQATETTTNKFTSTATTTTTSSGNSSCTTECSTINNKPTTTTETPDKQYQISGTLIENKLEHHQNQTTDEVFVVRNPFVCQSGNSMDQKQFNMAGNNSSKQELCGNLEKIHLDSSTESNNADPDERTANNCQKLENLQLVEILPPITSHQQARNSSRVQQIVDKCTKCKCQNMKNTTTLINNNNKDHKNDDDDEEGINLPNTNPDLYPNHINNSNTKFSPTPMLTFTNPLNTATDELHMMPLLASSSSIATIIPPPTTTTTRTTKSFSKCLSSRSSSTTTTMTTSTTSIDSVDSTNNILSSSINILNSPTPILKPFILLDPTTPPTSASSCCSASNFTILINNPTNSYNNHKRQIILSKAQSLDLPQLIHEHDDDDDDDDRPHINLNVNDNDDDENDAADADIDDDDDDDDDVHVHRLPISSRPNSCSCSNQITTSTDQQSSTSSSSAAGRSCLRREHDDNDHDDGGLVKTEYQHQPPPPPVDDIKLPIADGVSRIIVKPLMRGLIMPKTQSIDSRPIYPNVPYSPYGSPFNSPRSNRKRPPLRESRRISIDKSGSFHQLNQYKLLDQIGQGSYGLVKLAYNEEDSTHYAMKILSKRRLLRKAGLMGRGPKKTTSPLDRVYREIAVLKKLDHPNVVKLIEVLDDPLEDALYLAFELVQKGEILSIPTENPLSAERAWSVFRDAIQGLEYLHYQRIIHADIKPGNLLLGECGRVKIADLGVCNEFLGEDATLNNGSTAGTPAFRAPETLIPGQHLYSGKAADIWALGATLYSIIYGNVPFVATNVPAVYEQIKNAPLQFPDKPQINEDLRHLLTKLLTKDPNLRITLPNLKEDPWVTSHGQYPLASEEENCRLVQINDDDINSVVKSIPKLDTLILIKTMLKNHSFQNPFTRGGLGKRAPRFTRAGRSISAPGAYHLPPDRQLSAENILPPLTENVISSPCTENIPLSADK